MRYLIQSISICLPAFVLMWGKGGAIELANPMEPAEYKAADQNFYLRAAVLKAEPSAVIVSAGKYEQKGDSYFFTPRHKAPQEIYVEVTRDWLEPVTPPSMASLGVAPDVMQIREPQGDVQVAAPDNATVFVPATEGMPIANGAVVKTGKDGTAAVLFGGVDSARLAPGSEAMVQQTVMPELRSTRIDLKAGVVFSKVGLRVGEKQDYQVHTPFGVAAARGTDFVCVAMPDRTDVWIAQGTVEFTQPNGVKVGTVKASGKNSLKIIRFPQIADAHKAMDATTETMTAALNFIPTVNLKLKTLHDQMAQGVKLTPQEERYLTYMKQVPCLIRLSLVAPLVPVPARVPAPAPVPPPAPEPPVTPPAATPPAVPVPTPTTTTSAPELKPLTMRSDASVAPRPLVVDDVPAPPTPVKKKLSRKERLAKAKAAKEQAAMATTEAAKPDASASPVASSEEPAVPAPVKKKTSKKAKVAKVKPMETPTAAAAETTKTDTTKTETTKPETAKTETTKADSSASTVVAANDSAAALPTPGPTAETNSAPEAAPAPLRALPVVPPPTDDIPTAPVAHEVSAKAIINVESDGSIHFEGKQLSSGGLERRLAEIAKTEPDREVVIRGDRRTESGRIRTVLAMCHEAKLSNVTFDTPSHEAVESSPLIPDEHPISTSPTDTAP